MGKIGIGMANLIKIAARELIEMFGGISNESGFSDIHIDDIRQEWKPRNPNWQVESGRYVAIGTRQTQKNCRNMEY